MSLDFNSSEIRNALVKHYTRQELRTLCSDLGVPFEELDVGSSETPTSIARELISWLNRRRRLPELEPYLFGVRVVYVSGASNSSTVQLSNRTTDEQRVEGPHAEVRAGETNEPPPISGIVKGGANVPSQSQAKASALGNATDSPPSSVRSVSEGGEIKVSENLSSSKRYWVQLVCTLILGALLAGLLIGVFLYSPNTLPAFKQRIIAVACALLAGLFTFFLTGTIGLESASFETPLGKFPIKATGGGAVLILVLAWWLSPLAPIDVGGQPSPSPSPNHPNSKGTTEKIMTPLAPLIIQDRVNEVALNLEGDVLAAAENGGAIHIWQVKTGESPAELTKAGKPAVARCVAIGHNGVTIAAGGDGGKVRIWSAPNSPSPTLIPSHTNTIYEVYFSRDGQRLMVTGSDVGNIISARLWSISGIPKLLKTFVLPNLGDRILTVSSDLLLIALYNSQHKAIEIWSFADRKLVRALEDSGFVVTCGAFGQDGQFFMAGSDMGAVKRWQLKDGKQLSALKGASERVVSIAFHPNGQIVAAGYPDGSIYVWDIDNSDAKEIVKEHTQRVLSLTFSANGRVFASGGEDGKIQLWEIKDKG